MSETNEDKLTIAEAASLILGVIQGHIRDVRAELLKAAEAPAPEPEFYAMRQDSGWWLTETHNGFPRGLRLCRDEAEARKLAKAMCEALKR